MVKKRKEVQIDGKESDEKFLAIGMPNQGTFRKELSHFFWRPELPDKYRPMYLAAESTDIATARNSIIRAALEELDTEWILQIDSDIGADPTVPRRMIQRAEEEDIKILSAMTFILRNGVPKPLLSTASEGESSVNFIEQTGLIETDSVGTGCALVHREVFEAMDKPYFMQKYSEEDPGIREEAEDYVFSQKAKEAGFQCYIDADIIVPHFKTVNLQTYMSAISYAISCDSEEEFWYGV